MMYIVQYILYNNIFLYRKIKNNNKRNNNKRNNNKRNNNKN